MIILENKTFRLYLFINLFLDLHNCGTFYTGLVIVLFFPFNYSSNARIDTLCKKLKQIPAIGKKQRS